MKNPYRAFKLGNFKVQVSTENDTFIGMCYDQKECIGTVTSNKSWFDCALKGLSYLRSLNDMPSNYDIMPDTNSECLQ